MISAFPEFKLKVMFSFVWEASDDSWGIPRRLNFVECRPLLANAQLLRNSASGHLAALDVPALNYSDLVFSHFHAVPII